MKKKKNYYLRIFIALLFLANPNIHIIDILPDFIAYFLIFSVISEATGLAPHFSQAKEACKKLAILCLLKIPASFITVSVRSRNIQDANLIPTFAIIFSVFEIILAYTLIYHTSEGLFYLGERKTDFKLHFSKYVFVVEIFCNKRAQSRIYSSYAEHSKKHDQRK